MTNRGGFVSAETRLLERERELEAIRGALARSGDGDGAVLLIEAHAGLGKTTLLEILAAEAEDSLVLRAVGRPTEQTFAFGLVAQLFGPWLRIAPKSELARLWNGPAALARDLFSGAGAQGTEGAGESRELFSLLHGLYDLVAVLADAQPLVLAVDDAQWSDEASLKFLLYLLPRVTEMPVLLVVAARPGEGQSESLQSLRNDPLTTAVNPGPLSVEAVATLAHRQLPAAPSGLAESLYEATGGNPFLVGELLTEPRLENDPAGAAELLRSHVGEVVPEAVARSLCRRLEQLPDAATDIARAVAVIGSEASLGEVLGLAEISRSAAVEHLDRLADANVLIVDETITFVHPLVRAAVYNPIPSARLAELHLRAAKVLAAHAPDERVVSQLLLATRGGDSWVVEVLRSAAARARARGVPDVARIYLRRALEEPPGSEAGLVLAELAEAEVDAGDSDSAIGHFEQSLQFLEDPERRVRARLRLGRALWWQGHARRAAQVYDEAGPDLDSIADEATRSKLARSIRAAHAGAALVDLELRERAIDELEDVVDASAAGATREECAVMAIVAGQIALQASGPRERAIALAERALADETLLRDREADENAYYLAVLALALGDELCSAHRHLDAAVRYYSERGSVIGFASASYTRGGVEYYIGSMADAIADLEAALAMEPFGWEMLTVSAAATLAHARIEVGDLTGARSAIDVDEAEAGSSIGWPQLLFVRSRLRLLDGDPHGALADIERGAELLGHLPNPAHAAWRSSAAQIHLSLGDRERAELLAAEEVEMARGWGAPRALGRALRALGMSRRGESAVGVLREAADVLDGSPARLERARSLSELGAALRRSGRRREAREPLREAHAICAEVGATFQRERIAEELRASGERPPAVGDRPSATLTPGELRVARLAAEGLSNREIANRLFVTVKAVEWHLGNSYRKLSIRSRRELAEALG